MTLNIIQLHAGQTVEGKTIWYINSKRLYWSGSWGHRTPRELLDECTTTIRDLILNHPELLRGKLKEDNNGRVYKRGMESLEPGR